MVNIMLIIFVYFLNIQAIRVFTTICDFETLRLVVKSKEHPQLFSLDPIVLELLQRLVILCGE